MIVYAMYLFFQWKKANKTKVTGLNNSAPALLFSTFAPLLNIGMSPSVRNMKRIRHLKTAAIMIILIALARPQLTGVFASSETFGIDIILTLDVSGSMRAEDFKPSSRLFVAKEVLKEFISARHVDRMGLVVFAGKSYTQSPLTTDYSVLLNVLEEVAINFTDEGTAIGLAISESLNRLKNSDAKSKVIILLTDGENNAGNIDPILSAKLAKAVGIRVYTIGIGTGAGVPIPMNSFNTYAKASDGSVVITKLNEDVLKQIAQITGGLYYNATSGEALAQIYKTIGEMERSRIEVKEYLNYYELFPFFALIALALLFIEIVLTTTRYSTFP